MYQEIEGDIIEIIEQENHDILFHCHDCTGNLSGKIMSLSLNEEYNYDPTCRTSSFCTDISTLGCITIKRVMGEKYIGNGFSSQFYKRFNIITLITAMNSGQTGPYGCPFDYDAFRICLRKAKMEVSPMSKILVPTLGCGSQKADWNMVRDILKGEFRNLDITVCFKKKQNANTEQSKIIKASTETCG